MTDLHLQARLQKIRGFVFDIDGTLALADKQLNGYQALPGALQTLALLGERGIPLVAFTNGSTKTPLQLSQALAKTGFDLTPEQTLTPLSVAVADEYRRMAVDGFLPKPIFPSDLRRVLAEMFPPVGPTA